MNSTEIDRLIEQYVEERKHSARQVAQAHFMTHVHLVCSAGDVGQFLQHARGLVAYYIDSLSLFDNPFRNARVCWLLVMLLIFGFSIYLLTDENLRLAGMIVGSGSVIFGTSLWRTVWSRWLDTDLMIARYRELIELIDSMLPASNCETGG